MKLSIVTGVCGRNETTKEWFASTVGCAITKPEVVVVHNGSTPEEVAEISDLLRQYKEAGGAYSTIDLKEPVGSTKAFNVGVSISHGEYLALLHNDLMVKEVGWDVKLINFLDNHHEAGVIGFHGALALGANDIYRVPYELTQLARAHCFSNLEDAEEHGQRISSPVECIVVDGMAICCRRSDWEAWGGMDENYIHHMYDNDLCVTAHYDGKKNYVLPVLAKHVSGQTANYERYNQAFSDHGGDAGIHVESHEYFYKKWMGKLPVSIRGNVGYPLPV